MQQNIIHQTVLVHSVNQYSFIDEKTQKQNEGCTIRCALTEDFMPISDDTLKGYKPAKFSVAHSDFHKFPTVPGLYEMSMDYSVDSKGDVKMKPKDFQFVCGISITRADSGGNRLSLKSKETQ
jgi:hypothetical protein